MSGYGTARSRVRLVPAAATTLVATALATGSASGLTSRPIDLAGAHADIVRKGAQAASRAFERLPIVSPPLPIHWQATKPGERR